MSDVATSPPTSPLAAFIPKRMQIRAATHAILGELAAFQSVFNARMIAVRRAQLPACRIFITRDEWRSQSRVHDLGWFQATATLTVQIIVEAAADPETADQLDILCALAQHALVRNPRFRALVPLVEAITTDIVHDDQGEHRTAIATLEFLIHYTDCAQRDFGEWGDEGDNLEGAGDFRKLCLKLDVVDPAADPNTGPPGTPPNVPGGYPGGFPGPDGRIEVHADFVFPDEGG